MINAMEAMSGLTPAELTVKPGNDGTNGVVVSVVRPPGQALGDAEHASGSGLSVRASMQR